MLVGIGILASRLMGLVRERVFAHYLGNAEAAAVFKAALRIPNFLQNLFGEGVLSGSFIPVYAQLLGKKDAEESDRVAGAVFGLLTLATGVLVALGMLATPLFVDVIAPGFEGGERDLAIRLVRILFPGTGFLVLSAWCLGILNSHRRFLLSYLAPVVWNVVIIATLLAVGGRYSQGGRAAEEALTEWLAWGVVLGSFLQFAVQVPTVMRLLGRFRPALSLASASVRQVLKNFGPVVLGRGVVQFSAWVDTAFASLISNRALSSLLYAQTIYLIPVSLFGMAVSAAELPEMARATGEGEAEAHAKLRTRIDAGSRRIAFWVVPSAAALLFLGDLVSGALLQTGRFSAADSRYLWYLLMGAAVGLVASTVGRLYASAFYALKDPKTPLRYAVVRVSLGTDGVLPGPVAAGAAGAATRAGRRRPYPVQRHRGLGGDHALAPQAPAARGARGRARGALAPALGRGGRGRAGGAGRQAGADVPPGAHARGGGAVGGRGARAAPPAPGAGAGGGGGALRARLLRGGRGGGHPGSRRCLPQGRPAAEAHPLDAVRRPVGRLPSRRCGGAGTECRTGPFPLR